MNTVREMPMYELTGTELDAVYGGFFDFGIDVFQLNVVGVQFGLAIGGSVAQAIQQQNNSTI